MSGFGFSNGPSRTATEIDLKREAATTRLQALIDALALAHTPLYIAPSVAHDARIGALEGFRFIETKLPAHKVGDRVWLYPYTSFGIEAVVTQGPIATSNETYYRTRDIEGDERVSPARSVVAFDENHNQKRAYRQGKVVQCRSKTWDCGWRDCVPGDAGVPIWAEHCEYRIKPDPHAEAKAAHRAGKTIEARRKPGRYDPDTQHRWHLVTHPIWNDDCEYRVKPEPVNPHADLEAAVKAGKTIQVGSDDDWIDQAYRSADNVGVFTGPRSHYRIKPEPSRGVFVQRVDLNDGTSVLLEVESIGRKPVNVNVKEFS